MRPTKKDRLLHPGWTLTLPLLVLTALMACPPERRLFTGMFSALVYATLQWVLPRCRFRVDHYLCPVNIGLGLLLLKLVIVPVLIMMTGAESRVIASLPSMQTMEGAVQIDTIAYVAFCLGLTFAPRGAFAPRSTWLAEALSQSPGPRMIAVFVLLGFIGFASAFKSLPHIVVYFMHPEEMAAIQASLEGTWQGLIATILRPFLAFALVAWWAGVVDNSTGKRRYWGPVTAGVVAGFGITLANLTFSFNRAAFVFPLLCLVAVYSARIRRIPLGLSFAAVIVILPVLIAVGTYRSSLEVGATKKETSLATSIHETSENFQAYSGGPQFTGLFYDRIGWGEHLYGGSTILASALSTMPVLGKGFRDTNGPALFNFAIYGVSGIEDQIIPFATELFANFHAPGVVAGFILLGLFLSEAERWFAAARSTFFAFAVQYVSLWGAMLAVWSVAIYSQILIYFFLPIYFYLLVLKANEWLGSFNRQSNLKLGVAR